MKALKAIGIFLLILTALSSFGFVALGAIAPEKAEDVVRWAKAQIGLDKPLPPASFVFVAKEWQDFEEAVEQKEEKAFARFLEDQGYIKEGKIALQSLLKDLAEQEVLFKIFKERMILDEVGNLVQSRLYDAIEPEETTFAKILREQGLVTEDGEVSLILFEEHLRNQLGISKKEFPYPLGIRIRGLENKAGDGILETVKPEFKMFDIWGDVDISKAFRLLERHDPQADIPSAAALKHQMLNEKVDGKKVFAAVDNTLCYPIGFEIVTNLPSVGKYQGHHNLYPKAVSYVWDLIDEIYLPDILPYLERDANFEGSERDLKNAILQKNPNLLWKSGALKPGKIIVNPMARSWDPVEIKFMGLDEVGEGVLLMLDDRTAINERLPFIKEFVKDEDLKKMSGADFLEAIKTYVDPIDGKRPFINSLGEVQFPIGMHLSLTSGKYIIFSKEELTAHLPRRPIVGGGYEVDVKHDYHLYTALNYVKVDAGYPTTFGFHDFEKDIISRYPSQGLDGRVVFPFTLRITLKKGKKKGGYEVIPLGNGDLHVFLIDQREEDGIVYGIAERPIQLTEVARLLRMYGNPENFSDLPLPAYDGQVIMDKILEKSYYRYPSGEMRPIAFHINMRTGAYQFNLAEDLLEKESDAGDLEEGVEPVPSEPEEENVIYTIDGKTFDQYEEQMQQFAQEQGITNLDAVAEYLRDKGIRVPFYIKVNPPGSESPFEAYNLVAEEEE